MTVVVFPSPIPVARALLLARSSWVGTDRVATDMSAGALKPPLIRLTRVGGARLNLIQERSRVLVECYGATDEASEAMARRAFATLTGADADYVAGAWLYRVEETAGVTDYYDNDRSAPRAQFEVALTLRGQEGPPP